MKKTVWLYALAWSVYFITFQVICFAIPPEFTGRNVPGSMFWVSYGFICAAFIGQLICACVTLREDRRNKMFLHVPLITISYTGLTIMLVVAGLAMAIPGLPTWIGLIACVLVFAGTATAAIRAKAAADIVGMTGETVREQTRFIRTITTEAEAIMASASSETVRAACKRVWEAARCSDPISSNALDEIESQISAQLAEFGEAVRTDNGNAAEAAASQIAALLDAGNRQCRLYKQDN